MRKFATFNLAYLFFVAASALSTVHVDHAGSHQNICVGADISASCHADLPHDHEAAHAGQESFFEHTFEYGSFEQGPYAYAPLLAAAAAFEVENLPPRPVSVICRGGFQTETPPRNHFDLSPQSSRAPPAI